jgi:hypothetical protein
MKRLKFRYNKTEREHEYQEGLVISAKKTFEKLCSGVDDPMEAPAFDHDDHDPFLNSEYTIKELNFAIKNLKSPIEHGTGYNKLPHTLQLAKCSFRNLSRNV